eukprot:SAG31_NODE_605_length_13628_cov_24.848030_12_plen_164_part_00
MKAFVVVMWAVMRAFSESLPYQGAQRQQIEFVRRRHQLKLPFRLQTSQVQTILEPACNTFPADAITGRSGVEAHHREVAKPKTCYLGGEIAILQDRTDRHRNTGSCCRVYIAHDHAGTPSEYSRSISGYGCGRANYKSLAEPDTSVTSFSPRSRPKCASKYGW